MILELFFTRSRRDSADHSHEDTGCEVPSHTGPSLELPAFAPLLTFTSSDSLSAQSVSFLLNDVGLTL